MNTNIISIYIEISRNESKHNVNLHLNSPNESKHNAIYRPLLGIVLDQMHFQRFLLDDENVDNFLI